VGQDEIADSWQGVSQISRLNQETARGLQDLSYFCILKNSRGLGQRSRESEKSIGYVVDAETLLNKLSLHSALHTSAGTLLSVSRELVLNLALAPS
jgi:hypothetical protein